jgi:HPt (histidine-containing phosphotransfer) domain-containing protein
MGEQNKERLEAAGLDLWENDLVAVNVTHKAANLIVATTWTNAPGIIDLSVLERLVGGNKSKMREFALKFLASAQNDMAGIEAALERKDLAALCTLGHHNKGPSSMVGAMEFTNLCQALVDHGENGGAIEHIQHIVSQMRPLLDRINEQIDKDLA